MTLLIREPFNTNTPTGWSNAWSGVATVAGRTNSGIQFNSGGGALDYTIAAPDRSDTIILGFAWKAVDIATASHLIFNLRESSGPNIRLTVYANTDGSLRIDRSTTLGTTAAGLLVANTWAYIEVQAKFSLTVGTVIIRVDGVERLNLTNQNTLGSGTALFERVELKNTGTSNGTVIFDDAYIATGASELFRGPLALDTEARDSRQNVRVAFSEPLPQDWYRMARTSVRVAFQGATTYGVLAAYQTRMLRADPFSKIGGVYLRVLRSSNADAALASFHLRVLRQHVPPVPKVRVWTGAMFVRLPVQLWDGAAFVNSVAVRVWDGSAFEEAL